MKNVKFPSGSLWITEIRDNKVYCRSTLGIRMHLNLDPKDGGNFFLEKRIQSENKNSRRPKGRRPLRGMRKATTVRGKSI